MSADSLYAKLLPILLLMTSNVFMTFAWYGHLRFMQVPLMTAILASWGIAFIEYCLAVPANRYGYGIYSAAQLKTIQEAITLLVFAAFSVLYLKEPLAWNYAVGFALIAAGASSSFTNGEYSHKRPYSTPGISSRPALNSIVDPAKSSLSGSLRPPRCLARNISTTAVNERRFSGLRNPCPSSE